MTSTVLYAENLSNFQLNKADSTDDECSVDSRNQRTVKTNLCKYKTQMCKNYSEMGYCPYRAKCQFAHGQEELNRAGQNVKKAYRTKKCKSFWEEGMCRYGFRCQFLHYEPECDKQKDFLQTACNMLCQAAPKTQSRLNTILSKHRN